VELQLNICYYTGRCIRTVAHTEKFLVLNTVCDCDYALTPYILPIDRTKWRHSNLPSLCCTASCQTRTS